MGRRLLRLPSSSDEEDEEQHLQTLILNRPNPNPNPNPTPPPPPPNPPLEISDDDDFADVPDAFSPPSPPPMPDPSSEEIPSNHGGSSSGVRMDVDGEGSISAIDSFLRRLGLRLRRDWLESCVSDLASSHYGFEGLEVAVKAKLCFEHFLSSDMNHSGGGVLPENVHSMHGADLEGPFVLQVDEIVNISSPLRERYHDSSAGFKRCLKLSLTDGAQRVFGMEYRPIKDLEVLSPAGLKIAIRNVHIRRGLLMLVPEVLEVLGGLVEDLDAARQRLVDEINKPPRGKRNQSILPLSKRASLAAWPSSTTNNGEQVNVSTPHGTNLPQLTPQVATLAASRSDVGRNTGEELADSHAGRSTAEEFAAPQTRRTTEELIAPCTRGSITDDFVDPHIRRSTIDELSVPQTVRSFTKEFPAPCTGRSPEEFAAPCTERSITEECVALHTRGSYVEESPAAHGRADAKPIASSSTGANVNDIDMADEVEHPLILSGDREIPFTYMACLLAKLTANDSTSSIRGKIKCFLTGVKGFQFKQRSTFDLQVYIDDGSLISEVLVDHHVVQKGIGHSPKEVTTALSSSDKTIAFNMRETMKRFQLFLAKFEGTMLVEINRDHPIPVALEMNQGYSTSDAWLLLRRLEKFTALNS